MHGLGPNLMVHIPRMKYLTSLTLQFSIDMWNAVTQEDLKQLSGCYLLQKLTLTYSNILDTTLDYILSGCLLIRTLRLLHCVELKGYLFTGSLNVRDLRILLIAKLQIP